MAASSGWILLDKSPTIGSTRAVGEVRRLFSAQKCGHGGTLDPLAEGLLPIALNEATKTARFLSDSEKAYRFTLCWGVGTESHDREGRVTARSPRRPLAKEIDAMLPRFIGKIWQRPPLFSAIHVKGRRAYDLARKGEKFLLPPRMVTIHTLRRIKGGGRDRTDFEMRCGKGVYVRALARDLGEALGSPAHIDYLRRTAHGPFSEKDAITLQRLTALKENKKRLLAHLHPLESALQRLTTLNLSKKGALDLREGRRTALPSSARAAEGETLLALHGRVPVGIVRVLEGELCSQRIFNL